MLRPDPSYDTRLGNCLRLPTTSLRVRDRHPPAEEIRLPCSVNGSLSEQKAFLLVYQEAMDQEMLPLEPLDEAIRHDQPS